MEEKTTDINARFIVPFIIEITNNSEDKFYNVPLINFLNDQDKKIEYKGLIDNTHTSHEQLIQQLNNESLDISLTYISVIGDYNKYVTRQLVQMGFSVSSKEGVDTVIPFDINIDPMQSPSNVILIRRNYKLGKDKNGVLHNIKFEHLMPEIKVIVRVYPIEKINLKRD